MSTQPPGGPRRRRIAGERRGRGLPAETPPTSLSPTPTRSSAEQDELDRALAERYAATPPRPVDPSSKDEAPVVVPPPAPAAEEDPD